MTVEEEGRKIMCEAVEKYAKKKYSQGVRQGLEQGIEQGKVLGAIEICRQLGLDSNDIISRIISSFSLTRDEAESYMRRVLPNL